MYKKITQNIKLGAIYLTLVLGLFGLLTFSFLQYRSKVDSPKNNPKVTTTLLPIYDFAKQIGSDKASVSLILPPGAEPHDFEPRPKDIKEILQSDLFLYTSDEMEPWVQKIKQQNKDSEKSKKTKTRIVSVDKGILKMTGDDEHVALDEASDLLDPQHKEEHDHEGIDPHYWLDPKNAIIMAQNIADEMALIDKENAGHYIANSQKLISKLKKLDQDFASTIPNCKQRTIYHAGHFAFGYFAKRYGLEYHALQGYIPESETKASLMADFINSIKSENAKSIYFEELVDPKVANIIATETGAKTYLLNAAHTATAVDLEKGLTYEDIMRDNLKNITLGLQCAK